MQLVHAEEREAPLNGFPLLVVNLNSYQQNQNNFICETKICKTLLVIVFEICASVEFVFKSLKLLDIELDIVW